jgi:hypothetical protein
MYTMQNEVIDIVGGGREVINENAFPQMTTIQQQDNDNNYYEDGTVLLSEEQRLHFLSRRET